MFSGTYVWKDLNSEKEMLKNLKIARFLQNAKICDVKTLQDIPLHLEITVT